MQDRSKRTSKGTKEKSKRESSVDTVYNEYGLVLAGREEKRLPTYHQLKKLQDNARENDLNMAKFNAVKVRGKPGLCDPNAPPKLYFPSRDDRRRFNKSFKVDDVSIKYPEPATSTARSNASNGSDVLSFRSVSKGFPLYEPMRLIGYSGVSFALSKDSQADDTTISSRGTVSTEGKQAVVDKLTRNNQKSEFQKKYDEVRELATFKPFQEAYAEPARPDGILRERQILTSFFHALDGYNWPKLFTKYMTAKAKSEQQEWLSVSDHAHWHGVGVAGNGAGDGKDGLVVELVLRKRGLKGYIPLVLSRLVHLEMLDLSHNMLKGRIPNPLFCKMHDLQVLSLEGNQLSGEIRPSLLIALPNLRELWLGNNQLTGEIPGNVLEMCQNLTHLCLNNNMFTGKIPDTIR